MFYLTLLIIPSHQEVSLSFDDHNVGRSFRLLEYQRTQGYTFEISERVSCLNKAQEFHQVGEDWKGEGELCVTGVEAELLGDEELGCRGQGLQL